MPITRAIRARRARCRAPRVATRGTVRCRCRVIIELLPPRRPCLILLTLRYFAATAFRAMPRFSSLRLRWRRHAYAFEHAIAYAAALFTTFH